MAELSKYPSTSMKRNVLDNQSLDTFRWWYKDEEKIGIKLYKAPHSFKWHGEDEDDNDDNDVDKEKYFKLPSRWVLVFLRSLALSSSLLLLSPFLPHHYSYSHIEHIWCDSSACSIHLIEIQWQIKMNAIQEVAIKKTIWMKLKDTHTRAREHGGEGVKSIQEDWMKANREKEDRLNRCE